MSSGNSGCHQILFAVHYNYTAFIPTGQYSKFATIHFIMSLPSPPRSPGRSPGAEGRLWCLTYTKIATWTGLTVSTVRSYASRKVFNAHSLTSTLSWVNARRAAAGLPLIGTPQPQPQPPQPQSSELTPLNYHPPANAELDTPSNKTTPTPPLTPTPAPTCDAPMPPPAPHYNPITGDFLL